MSWMHTIPYLVGTAAFLLIPGLVVMRAAGIRGLGAFAFAIPASATVIGVFAVIAGLLNIPWGAPVYVAGTLIVALMALLGRFALAIWRTDINHAHSSDRFDTPVVSRLQTFRWGVDAPIVLIYVAAVALPAFAIFYRYAHGIGNVERISQTFDNIYHLNAIRAIIDTHNGSSLTLGNLTPESQGFYPAVWHDIVSLIVMVFHVSIPAAVNVTNIVIACLVWPLALLFFITRITGPRLLPIVLTAALAPAFPSFPYLMVEFGVLYPNHLAIAILPAILGAVLQILGMTQAKTPTFWLGVLSFAAAFPGMVLSHPSTLLALIAFVLPVMVTRLWWTFVTRHESDARKKDFRVFLGVFAGYAVISLMAWIRLRPAASSSNWPPFQTPARSTGEVLAGTPMGLPGGTLMFLLTCTGIIFLFFAKRQRWVVGMFGMGAMLYIISSSYPFGDFRSFFSGIWYNDSNRLAAILPIVSAPVVILGAEFLVRWLTKIVMQSEVYTALARSKAPVLNNRLIISALLALALVGVMAFRLQSGAMTAEQSRFNSRYYIASDSLLLSSDERRLLDDLPNIVPADQKVLGNPWTGASLVYAISGRQTTKPHIYGRVSDDDQYLLDHLDEIKSNPEVCKAVRATKTYWTLDFGKLEVHRGDHALQGTDQLEQNSGFELVAQAGNARLYKVNGCQ